MSKMDAFSSLVDQWRANSVSLLPPASLDEVAKVFAELQQPLSRDVLRLYTQVNGFEEYETDNVWSWWSLSRVLEENQTHRPKMV